jgi:hypothetical protein
VTSNQALIEHVADRIATAAEGVPFGEAVAHVERRNEAEGFELGDEAGLRLEFDDFLTAVALVITWGRTASAPPMRPLSAAALAVRLGVPLKTLQSWRRRYRGTAYPVPTPDVEIPVSTTRGVRMKGGWSVARAVMVQRWQVEDLPRVRRTGGWPKGRPRAAAKSSGESASITFDRSQVRVCRR